ncbi:cysteine hydrolase [Roseospira marina]|uniref:Cysteine hydrolase n=1 Tax=Roseospira marina TaxID=140057 RepID=A0A5M6IDV2_9PROT|nr:isochorismatase family cysteine hydrolase [Roseospira marina]KAA5606147.1 cysteine hydrolase [Roseospira marina]MBB4314286.1 nicotinamidase-related amidase [Roseospira marina]MBB5087446.1 nicotinamidase-related amidase [Roseospira marina]
MTTDAVFTPTLDPVTTALLLIDVQRYVLDPSNHPPRPEFDARARDVVLPNMARLLEAARGSGVEVIYTVMGSLTRDGRDRSLDYKLSGFEIVADTPAAAVVPEVAPVGDEIVLPKTSANLFNSTPFAYVLRNMGIRTVLCTGFLTDQCVEQTMKAGPGEGFAMVGIPDACAANTDIRHTLALARFASFGAQWETAAILRALAAQTCTGA